MNKSDSDLIKENNEALKEILSFVRKVDSKEYRDNALLQEFLCNVSANALVESMEPEQRKQIYEALMKKGV